MTRKLHAAAALVIAFLLPQSAQADYPDRTVDLVIPESAEAIRLRDGESTDDSAP